MDYIKVATIDEFENRQIKSVTIMAKKVGIIKRDDGSFYATETGCKHQNADLLTGKIENGVATCPRHGWQYNLESGECLNHDSPVLRKYDLIVEGNEIKISLTPVEY